ncbi:MAG: 4-(cytidine 5'-diphospho)-2-C-methyl-D-erythritol kinase [Fervidobacterium sp.]
MGQGCRIILRTYGKLNLCLDVISKREDGYHEIDSLFQNVSIYDDMEIIFSDGNGKILIESNFKIKDNIVKKIWDKVNCNTKDVYVKILKHIPMGSGLGGGSSNAAGFILALEKAGIISKNDIVPLALSVGSDVLFFMYGGTAIVKGRGDVVMPVEPLNGCSVELFFPGFSISTKEAYSKLDPEWFGKAPMSSQELYECYKELLKKKEWTKVEQKDLAKIKVGTYNIFEKIMPDEVTVKIEKLRNKYPAALTGSGSTYFSIVPYGAFHFVDKGVEIYAFEKIIG